MESALVAALASLVGVLIGSVITYRAVTGASSSSTHAKNEPEEDRPPTGMDLYERLVRLQFDEESKRRKQDRVADSYGKLLGWLYELEVAIDAIWLGASSTDASTLDDTRKNLREWPLRNLKPPRYVASTQHYWSEETRELLNKFYTQSSSYIFTALATLNRRAKFVTQQDGASSNKKPGEAEKMVSTLNELSDEHLEMRKVFTSIRENARKEID